MTDDDTDEHDEETSDDPFADVEGVEAEDDPFGAPDDVEDPFAEVDDEFDDDPFADIEGVEAEDDPFTDMAVGSEADPSTDFGPSDNTLFTDAGAEDIDDEEVWARIAGSGTDEETTSQVTPETEPEALDAPTSPETVVDKRSYCERCEYFSDPPEVGCGYPEGEIVELVDTERFRVRNCPIVEQRRSGDISEIAGRGTTDVAVEDNESVGSSGDADD